MKEQHMPAVALGRRYVRSSMRSGTSRTCSTPGRWQWCGLLVCILVLAGFCQAQSSRSPRQSAETLYQQGLEQIRQGRLAEAQRTLVQAHTSAPENVAISISLGKLDTLLGQADDAVALFKNVERQASSSTENEINLAIALATQGSLQPALDAANLAVERSPASGPAHHIRAKILAALQLTKEASTEYQKAESLAPQDALTLYDYAIFCDDTGDLQREIELLQRVVHLLPENARDHFLLGQAMERTGASIGARREFRETIRLDPANRSALYSLSRSLRQDDPAEAARLAARFHAVRVSDEELNKLRDQGNAGVAAMARAAWPEAVATFQAALAGCAGCSLEATLEKDLGLAQCQGGDPHAGLASLRRSLALKPEDAETLRAIEITEKAIAGQQR